jgi:hypothetical protein
MRGRKHLTAVGVAVALSAAVWGATHVVWDDADYRKPPERTHAPPLPEPAPSPTPRCDAEEQGGLCFVFYFTPTPEP